MQARGRGIINPKNLGYGVPLAIIGGKFKGFLDPSKQQVKTAAAANNPLREKAQNLPLLCVEAILKFTPTSKLIRLYSNAVPLPGAFWDDSLKALLEKRMPLSLRDQFPCRVDSQTRNIKALSDATEAKIATVTKPEMFLFSPLLKFIESATLTLRTLPMEMFRERLLPVVVHGDALLSHMPNVVHLALVVDDISCQREGKDRLVPCLQHLLPKLESFDARVSPRSGSMFAWPEVDRAMLNFIHEARIAEMTGLKRLVLHEVAFDCLARTAYGQSDQMQAVLTGLRSLCINYTYLYGPARIVRDNLRFISRNCVQLSELQVVVRGAFKAYLAAFRAFPGLTSLGLDVLEADLDLTGLTFDGSGAISSVVDYRIVCSSGLTYVNHTNIFKISTFFPNARAVALKAGCLPDPLELAMLLFGERQLFPGVARLSCFYSFFTFVCPSQQLSQFLANPHLPEAVDFSQTVFGNLADDANLLTGIFRAMQTSSIKSLLLRGPVHRESLPRLQSHIDLYGENAKVSAWKDRDLGAQFAISYLTEISKQTEFQIAGLKTSGNLKGERFTIRVFHDLAKHGDIFD